MPEIGASKLAGDLGNMIGDVKKAMDDAKADIAGAIGELVQEVKKGGRVATAIRNEAAAVRKGYAGILGNDPTDEAAAAPDPTNAKAEGA